MSAIPTSSSMFIARSALVVGPYRYWLEREMARAGKTAAVIGVNPSTADSAIDDHTVRKLYGFSQRLGIRQFVVGNAFAYRATNIAELRTASDPIGPDNDRHLSQMIQSADLTIVAWGSLSKLPPALRNRWRAVAKIINAVGAAPLCFGIGRDGHPKHPLMLAYGTPLVEWNPPS